MAHESNGWRKIVLAFLIPTAIALISYGTLRSDVKHLESEMQGKATRETIQAQYQDILQRLDRIERRLDARAAR